MSLDGPDKTDETGETDRTDLCVSDPPGKEAAEIALFGKPFFPLTREDYLLLKSLAVAIPPGIMGRRMCIQAPQSLAEISDQIGRFQNSEIKARLLRGEDTVVAFPCSGHGSEYRDTAAEPMQRSPLDRMVFGKRAAFYTSTAPQPLSFFKIEFTGGTHQDKRFFCTGPHVGNRVDIPNFVRVVDELAAANADLGMATVEINTLREAQVSSRRRFLELSAAAMVGSFVAGLVDRFRDEISLPDILRETNPESRVERLRDLPGLEAILAASLREKDAERGTQKDNLIDPFMVMRQFLGGKFWYTGRAKNEEGQRVHRFAIIGERSKYLDRNGEGKTRFNSTTLSDAINNLLDYERLSDEEIKKWIVFTYKRSFGVENLQADRITIERDKKTKKVTSVTYNPQPGFEKKFLLAVPKSVEGAAPDSMQGMPTTKRDYYSILGAGNRLVLQSGISPDHDLYVPANLLDTDKNFRMPLGKRMPESPEGYGQFGSYELSASYIADAIHWQEERTEKNGHARVEGNTSDGRSYSFTSTGSFVPTDNPMIKELADFLIQTIKDADRERYVQMGITDPKAQEIQRLTEYVQSTDYVWENDNDFNRHPLITLFNEGSDCNNKTVLWSSLLAARKLDHAILYIANRKYSHMSHVLGGIDASMVPPPAQNNINNGVAKRFRHFAVVESTSPFSLGRTFERPEIEKEIAVAEWLHFDSAGNLQIDIMR